MNNRIRELRRQKNMTIQGLADRVGTSKSQIDKLEREERRLTVDWMMRIARALDVPAAALLPSPSQSIPRNPHLNSFLSEIQSYQGAVQSDLPVINPRQTPIKTAKVMAADEYTRRPANLYGVHNAFAVYMTDSSMSPRFYPGETLFINPNKPPTENCFVLAQSGHGPEGVFQFKGESAGKVKLCTLNPPACKTSAAEDVQLYRIVSMAESA